MIALWALTPVHASSRTADYCDETSAEWHKDLLAKGVHDVDLSHLNHRPAGKHGFLKAAGEALAFEDGTPVRFWGTNVVAGALFNSSDAEIAWHAKQLAMLGFNLVRFHHHDSMRWVNPSAIDEQRSDSQHLDPIAMDRLDRWIAALRERGIYVWLDMHTGRVFGPGDEIPDYQELHTGEGAGEAKGFNYLNPRIEQLMADFQKAYLSHVNKYTGLSYVDDPTIAFAQVTNENDFSDHQGTDFTGRRFPGHQARHDRGLREFARSHDLPAERMLGGTAYQALNLWRNEVEHRFNVRMVAALRKAGFRGLVSTTSLWGDARLHSLPPLADGDVVDVHSYTGPGWMQTDPRDAPNFALKIATGQLLGRPVTISEWNADEPLVHDRHTASLYLAALASFQGWDAPMLFGYAARPFDAKWEADPWTSYADPAIMGMMPAAALLFREGHVATGEKLYVIEPSADVLMTEWRDIWRSPALRTLVERHRVAINPPKIQALRWWKPAKLPKDAVRVVDLDRRFLAGDAATQETVSDTGELRRNWRQPVFQVETPLSIVASGALGSRSIGFENAQVRISNESATVAITSLDGKPIQRSGQLLISAVGRTCTVENAGSEYRSEPIRGRIWLRRSPPLPSVSSGPDAGPSVDVLAEGEKWLEVPLEGVRPWLVLAPPEFEKATPVLAP